MAVWIGAVPVKCEMCGVKFEDIFIDGRTQNGPWANMCIDCHTDNGCGLGTGRGQKYCMNKSTKMWTKVAG